MSFSFTVRRVANIAGVVTLDGILEGQLANGATATGRTGGESVSIVVKTVAFVDPPAPDRYTTLTIEPPSCPLEWLAGVTFVGD